MLQQPNDFGEELRKRRLAAGMSLGELSARVNYSKAHLSKVERGIKKACWYLARLCDAALEADGELAVLVPQSSAETSTSKSSEITGDVWILRLSADGESSFTAIDRRQALAAGAAAVAGLRIGLRPSAHGLEDTSMIEGSRVLFDHFRQTAQSVEPGLVLPPVIAQSHILGQLAARAGTGARPALLRLSSRYAEYIGWLVQETGNEDGALWWTSRAVRLAAAGGDDDLAAYARVRHALITLYRGHARQTVQLAEHARTSRAAPRIRGLAAQRKAQGHALAGEYDACMRALDQARPLLAEPSEDPREPVIGSTNLADPVEMITGWCLYDLGRPQAAAEVIGTQLVRTPKRAVRTRVRYGIRQALALAAAGEIEQACAVTAGLLPDAIRVGASTVVGDLDRLDGTLRRHPTNSAVRQLAPDLARTVRGLGEGGRPV
ncbi:helix-turn-helix domain-containing protein [Actinomadura gamaensis]|uniref:Helix-turn-helix domain-containing protein n=1 Tax=Actinomadura gamaensis TaxID=1763541 RepID=A0ABV9TTX7_9ACTN